MEEEEAVLVVLAGLPGTGKTTIARPLATRLRAAWLRIDTIEAALARSALGIHPAEDAGYVAACALAADNLSNGLAVVADSVNPVAASRAAWREVAREARVRLVEVEVICSDSAEHRRRVETRRPAMTGQNLPAWQDVLRRTYAPWDRECLVVDTARLGVAEAVARIAAHVGGRAGGSAAAG